MSLFDRMTGLAERTAESVALSRRPLVLIESADEHDLLGRFKIIAKTLKVPGWTTSATMEHNMARIYLTRRDGAKLRLQQTRAYSSKAWPLKIHISGDYLRVEKGSGYYGVGYSEKLPEANVTLKETDTDSTALAKVAKRLASAIQKKLLPKYLPIWEKGKEAKAKHDAHASAAKSAGGAFASAFPNLVKPYGDDQYNIGSAAGSGPYGDARVHGTKLDLSLRNLSVQQATDAVKALRLR